MTARRRGAQPGNTNALKHGRYSARCRSTAEGTSSAPGGGAVGEIALLRTLIRRLVEHLEEEDLTTKEYLAIFRAITSAAVSIGSLLRTQAALDTTQADEITQALHAALQEVTQELGH
jgi:hypothetical protein